jgi:hypothetical protein
MTTPPPDPGALAALKEGQQQILQAIAAAENSFLRQAVSLAADLVGVVSIVGIPSAVLSLISLFEGGDSSAEQALGDIGRLLQVTFDYDQSAQELTDMHRVDDLASGAYSRLSSLLQEQLPYLPESLDSLNFETRKAMDALSLRSSWMRVHADVLDYQDYWFGRASAPPDTVTSGAGRSFVFDYRLTLPCYLKALATRMAAFVVLVGSGMVAEQTARDELAQRAADLQSYLDTILRGFTPARTPGMLDVFYRFEDLSGTLRWSVWDTSAPGPRVIGVVDAFQGGGLVDEVPVTAYPNPTDGPWFPPVDHPPMAYLDFAARYELGVRARHMALYEACSLHDAWTAIQQTRAAAGQATAPTDLDVHWSLRDIVGRLGVAEADIVLDTTHISLWDTVRRLAILGAVDRTGTFQVSFRETLQAAAF